MKKSARGFTLVELLVVMAIIAILATVGVIVFKGVTSAAKDARRKGDIEALAKAYELKYQATSSYQAIGDADFASGKKPTDPLGGDYYNNVATDNSAYRVCAALESNPQRTCSSPSQNCYCTSSAQGSYQSQPGNGIPPDPPSCDPNGTLTYGIVGWWKLNGNTNDIIGTNNGTATGGFSYSAVVPSAQFSQSGYFDGSINTQITVNPLNGINFNNQHTFTAWFKYNGFNTGSFGGKGGLFRIMSPTTGSLRIYTVNASDNPLYVQSGATNVTSGSLNDLQWYNYAYTYDGTNITVYLNGQARPSVATPISVTGGYLSLGNSQWYLKGYLADVRIYNRALSQPEVAALYNGGNGCI